MSPLLVSSRHCERLSHSVNIVVVIKLVKGKSAESC